MKDDDDEDKKDKDEGNADADDEAGASAEDEDSSKEEQASAKDDDEEGKDTDEPNEEESVEADDEEAEEKPKKRAAKSEDDDDSDDEETQDKPKREAGDADVDDDGDANKDEPEKKEPEAGDSEGSGRPKATDADLTIPQDTHLQMAQRLPAKGEAAAGDEKPSNLSPEVFAKPASAQAALKEADEALAEARAQMDSKAPKAELSEPAPAKGGMDFQLVKEIAIPVVAFVIGAILHRSESTAVFGKLAMFFGAQTVMNLYMKEVLSGAVVDEEAGLHGFPSAFIVTALQQLVGFLVFGAVLIVLSCTPYAYTPKKISEPMEWLAVVLFSFSFTLNIALNNFSISLLPLSVNLIIRSCLPLATFVSQRVASQCTNEPVKDARAIEILCMLLGVACAAVAVVAKSNGGGGEGQSKTLVFGVIVCVASLFSGAINLALAGVLGTSCKLNSLDTTIYMSVPAFIFLVLPSLFYRHPVSWPDHGSMTDWEVMMVVLDKKLSVVGLAAFSGVLALFYNVFQYGIVHSLSASYTAFAGNFNKAATIALGLLVGLERLPPGYWGIVMALACLGNIGAFTAFNIIKMRAKKDEPKKEADGQGDEKADLIADADKGKV